MSQHTTKQKQTFEEYLLNHPYVNTRSFTKEDWESSMYEKWEEENREAPQKQKESGSASFTKGEWIVNHFMNEFSIYSKEHGGICKIPYVNRPDNKNLTEEQAEARANFIYLAPAMYEAIQEYSSLLDGLINRTPTGKQRNELCDMNIKVKAIINSIEGNKLK